MRQRVPLSRRSTIRRQARHETRLRDPGYIHWLHGLPCVACIIEGPPRVGPFPIEAAHQKHVAGVGGMLGKRPSDKDACPLCAWHHRLAPHACDPAQRAFWERFEIDIGDFCRSLYQSYEAGAPGKDVVWMFAFRRVTK